MTHASPTDMIYAPAQHGFTLLEVLISIVILAVGLLGIASLQTVGMRQTLNSQLITQASFQGNDMAERMRANMAGVREGAYNAISGSETDPACLPSCSPAQLAQHDAAVWAAANKILLNDSGSGSVSSTVINNGDDTFTIAISWTELAMPDEVDSTGKEVMTATNNFTMRFQP